MPVYVLSVKITEPTEKDQELKGKEVNVLHEQEKTSVDADKHDEELSNVLCTVNFNVMPDEVEIDWTEVKRGRRSGRNRLVKFRADHAERPTELKSCRRGKHLEVYDESTHATKIHQLQRVRSDDNCEIRHEDHDR